MVSKAKILQFYSRIGYELEVYKLIEWRFARFYSIQTKAMRGINRKI